MIERDEAITRIKAALKTLTGRAWSVTGGRGTAWGWLNISAFPRQTNEFGYMTDEDCEILTDALDTFRKVHFQGHDVAPKDREWFVEHIEALAAGEKDRENAERHESRRARDAMEAEQHEEPAADEPEVDEWAESDEWAEVAAALR